MEVRVIHDVNIVHEFLKTKTRYDYIYQFSNLSSERWKYVVCYGLFCGDEIKEIAMINMNYDIPVLLAASFNNESYSIELLKKIKRFLPPRFYTHIDKITLQEVFTQNKVFELEEYMNMSLCDYDVLGKRHDNEATRLGSKDIGDIKELISTSYPEAWLDDELVELNENFGVYADDKLISFAGIHAYSEQYQVAAIAHVTTHPAYRKRGYAEKAIAALLESLNGKIKFIGLNVKVDNVQAINCYRKLGFKEYGKFVACEIGNDIVSGKVPIDHLNRYVSNVDSFITFYREVLGYELLDRGTKANGKAYAILKGCGHELFISEKDNFIIEDKNFRHIGYAIEEVDTLLEVLKNKGYAARDTQIIVKQFSKQFYLEDPDGFEIDFIQWTDKEGFYKNLRSKIQNEGN